MRRSLLYVAVLSLTAGIAIHLGLNLPRLEQAQAQDSAADAIESIRKATKDPFAVPEAAEVDVLYEFISTIKGLRPAGGPALEEYEDKAPKAIRKACERILELDRDAGSAKHQFAQRELLTFRMTDLSEADDTDGDERKRITTESVQFLKRSERSAADVDLATTLATTFEDFAPAQEARAYYQALGELFIKNADEAIAGRGQFLLGAARRLDIVGHAFSLKGTTISGQPFDISAMKGKVVLVDFWATWCGHCLEEFPRLKRNYQAFRERGFEIVGVNVDDDRDDLLTSLKKQRLPWTTLHDDEAGAEHPAVIQYGISAYPTSFLIGRDGRVLAVDLRGRKLSQKLRELLGPVVEKASPYPALYVGDVLDELTSTGTKLFQQGKTKTDAELREGLQRESVELTLPTATELEITDRDLYRRATESVFVICSLYKVKGSDDWQTALASAFAVTKDGILSTSCHVFDNEDEADAVIVMDVQKRIYPVLELVAANRHADTCLFRIDAQNLKPLPLAEDALPGTKVRVLGHPGDSFYFMSSGLLANYERDHEGTLWMNTTADFGQGSSGGPVLDEFGNVVGQVSRTFTLYAGGSATRGRPRKVASEKTPADRETSEKVPTEDTADPQMVFKACVPVKTLRALIKTKSPE